MSFQQERDNALDNIDVVILLPEKQAKLYQSSKTASDFVLVNKGNITEMKEQLHEYEVETKNEIEKQRFA